MYRLKIMGTASFFFLSMALALGACTPQRPPCLPPKVLIVGWCALPCIEDDVSYCVPETSIRLSPDGTVLGTPDVQLESDASDVPSLDASTDMPTTCPGATQRCGATCVDTTTSPDHCGACGNVCPQPVNGATRGIVASCTSGACTTQCADGWESVGMGECDVKLPRAVAPLSTTRVSSRTPRLRWSLPAGLSGAHVEICQTATCFNLTTEGDARTEFIPPNNLPAGLMLWRLRGVVGGRRSTRTSPIWSAWIPAQSAANNVQTSWGHLPDIDGDGLGDLVVLDFLADCMALGADCRSPRFSVHRGGPALLESGNSPVETIGASSRAADNGIARQIGDVNGDGRSDVVFGDAFQQMSAGRVEIFHGVNDGTLSTRRVLSGLSPRSAFGFSVAGIGDVNSDGYGDLAISAPGESPGGINGAGTVRVYHGTPDGILNMPTTTLVGDPNSFLGLGLMSSGDFNGDGFGDLAVGSVSLNDAMPQRRSEIFIYYGSVMGLSSVPALRLQSPRAMDAFGISIGVGDFNGDGYADIWAGNQGGRIDVATGDPYVQLFVGGPTGIAPMAIHALTDGTVGPGPFGIRASVADIDADGFEDWISISQRSMMGSQALIFSGSASALQMASRRTIATPSRGTTPSDLSFIAIGDHNGDGFLDFVRHQAVTVSGAQRYALDIITTLPGGGIANMVSGGFLLPANSLLPSVVEN